MARNLAGVRTEKTMRGLSLFLFCSFVALASAAAPRTAQAQTTQAKGKDCRMEQQCHWKDFKKICVWVKVCR
jgi:hypothetical protein